MTTREGSQSWQGDGPDQGAGHDPLTLAPVGAVPPYDAVIFDMDGVATDSVELQAAAWNSGTVDLMRRLRSGGVPVGLVTARRNADALPGSARLEDLFTAVVDGTVAGELGLPGQPDPATFLEAARRTGVAPSRTAVVANATTGVEAARRGGFGFVVGIGRDGRPEALEEAGADVVFDDVALLDLGVLRTGPWALAYEGFDSAHEGHREALTTVGNGYFATRGAAPERRADSTHYPGTYLAGVYNRLTSEVHGRQVESEHMVNAPNWLLLDLRFGEVGWWSGGALTVDERRELDLRHGVLTRTAVLSDRSGRRLHVTQRRLVSMARPHIAALETTLRPEGWSGQMSVRSGIDTAVVNGNVAEDGQLANRHLTDVRAREEADHTLVVEATTSQSRITIAVAQRTTLGASDGSAGRRLETADGWHAQRLDFAVRDGQSVTITKTVAIATSRDPAITSASLAASGELDRVADSFAELVPEHQRAWDRLWDRFGIELDAGDRRAQLVLNLHVFHLLQTLSPHTTLVDAGVPARGLHGEGYMGHVFWDELFVLPVIAQHLPSLARALLDYRWRRLDAARQAARDASLPGAMFPWQSGSDGREETPKALFNLRSGRWMPDNSSRQRHVGLAVAYNAWQHYQITGDAAWLGERGAELIVEVARLFAGLAAFDASDDRYHIEGVMGPDEYHDGYPEAPGEGLRDNAYTNVLAAWVFERAAQLPGVLGGPGCDEMSERLSLRTEELEAWTRLSRSLAVAFHGDGIISQFAGYEALAEFDWARYRARYGNIGRLDLILEAEGDTTLRYRLSKQADVLMLLYLLGPDGVIRQLDRLGYRVTGDDLAKTVDYYLERTSHGSTLSRIVHASVLAGLDPTRAWDSFRAALAADLDDTQGGTTREGIHLGAMAGTIDIVTRAFAGRRTEGDELEFNPRPPVGLHGARFEVGHRRHRLEVELGQDRLRVSAHPCSAPGVVVRVAGQARTLLGGQRIDFVVDT